MTIEQFEKLEIGDEVCLPLEGMLTVVKIDKDNGMYRAENDDYYYEGLFIMGEYLGNSDIDEPHLCNEKVE